MAKPGKKIAIAPRSFAFRAFVTTFAFIALFGFSRASYAAMFQLTPSVGTFNSGARFTVDVSIDSEGTAINSAEGVITFPTRYLSVEKIDTSVSIFKFWVQEPIFSNAAGSISFGGGLPTPGYNGSGGKIFRVTFVTTGAGVANLTFDSGAILANDGVGTNVLRASGGGKYDINVQKISPFAEPIQATSPQNILPQITSDTHPEQDKWYNAEEFRASWELPSTVSSVNYAFVTDPEYVLPAKSSGALSSISYNTKDYQDGTWYFYLRFRTGSVWGPAVKRTVKIDRTAPAPFDVIRLNPEDITNPQPTIRFETTDGISGIAEYQIKIDGGDSQVTHSPEYQLPSQEPGEYTVYVRALDSAGNSREDSLQVVIRAKSYSWFDRLSDLSPLFAGFISLVVALLLCAKFFLFIFPKMVTMRNKFVRRIISARGRGRYLDSMTEKTVRDAINKLKSGLEETSRKTKELQELVDLVQKKEKLSKDIKKIEVAKVIDLKELVQHNERLARDLDELQREIEAELRNYVE